MKNIAFIFIVLILISIIMIIIDIVKMYKSNIHINLEKNALEEKKNGELIKRVHLDDKFIKYTLNFSDIISNTGHIFWFSVILFLIK